jgi:GTP cyclohydrolase IB
LNKSELGIDIAGVPLSQTSSLEKAGMRNIESFVRVNLGQETLSLPAKIDAFVSLDAAQKGIHMSRLFLAVQEQFQQKNLSARTVSEVLEKFLQSHAGISRDAYINVRFDLPLLRPALLSGNQGYRHYPVELWATNRDGKVEVGLHLAVLYSSTCPCSASLARQLIRNQFQSDFKHAAQIDRKAVEEWLLKESSLTGTPHGQRSEAKLQAVLATYDQDLKVVLDLIDRMEAALKTPVQTAVKREDEQEFARLNAANLMFAEDAVRRLHAGLLRVGTLKSFRVEAHHYESLHPHDAVAVVGHQY